jgi:hypothetical protein
VPRNRTAALFFFGGGEVDVPVEPPPVPPLQILNGQVDRCLVGVSA